MLVFAKAREITRTNTFTNIETRVTRVTMRVRNLLWFDLFIQISVNINR